MAPHFDGSSTGEEAASAEAKSLRPISTVVLTIAMQAEALPFVNKFSLTEDTDSPLRIDSVGTVPASLVTYASIEALQPDIIINAGTCGGFQIKGASIGDVFLASDVAFHDRRIPIPVFDLYGIGLRPAFTTPNLPKKLNLKVLSC